MHGQAMKKRNSWADTVSDFLKTEKKNKNNAIIQIHA